MLRTVLVTLVVLAFSSGSWAVEFQELLKGNEMPGWEEKGDVDRPLTERSWKIEDGVLTCTGAKGGGWWGSKQDYTDFIFEFDFKLPPGGNSGVYIRTPKKGHPSFDGMEVQLLDDPAPVYKDILPGQHCGSIYKIAPPMKNALKPANEWQHMRVTAVADHIVVELNGEVIVDADGQSVPDILKRSKRGPLGLQNHSSSLWFRNLRVADLAADRAERSKWFRDAKFGMFIHWGVYSVIGEGEWIMKVRKIKAADYERLPSQFEAKEYKPEAWAKLAKQAGCKYVVITSKHHDGFAMFDTKTTKYDVVDASVYGKDPMKPLADAVRSEGLRFGFYHSILDWHHPDYTPVPDWDTEARASHKPDFEAYTRYLQEQVREICTNYGPLACIWWDGGWDHKDAGDRRAFARVNQMVRELQPQILINNRAGLPEDFDTPEQFIPPTGLKDEDGTPKLWENCITLTDTRGWWGYDKLETKFKTPEYCIRMLIDVVSKGGNLLLNVGPDDQGRIGPNETKTLEAMGEWLGVNGEAIYGTTASPFPNLPFYGRATVKGDKLYLHVFAWPADHKLTVPGLRNAVKSARLLAGGASLEVAHEKHAYIITLPDKAPDAIAGVVELQLEGEPSVAPYSLTQPDANGAMKLSAIVASLHGRHGQKIRLEPRNGNVDIDNWVNAKDSVSWTVQAAGAGKFELVLTMAANEKSKGGRIVVTAGKSKFEVDVPVTADGAMHDAVIGQLELPADSVTLEIKPLKMPEGAPLMTLRGATLRPVK